MATYGMTKEQVKNLLQEWKNLSHKKRVQFKKQCDIDYPRKKSLSQSKKWRRENEYKTFTI